MKSRFAAAAKHVVHTIHETADTPKITSPSLKTVVKAAVATSLAEQIHKSTTTRGSPPMKECSVGIVVCLADFNFLLF